MSRTPSHDRFLALLGLLVLAPGPLQAQPSSLLTEEEAVARALARDSLRDVLEGSVEEAAADVTAARRWKNPVLSYTFERAQGGGGGSSEGITLLQQQFEPNRRRRLRTQAAEARVEGASERAAMLEVEVEARVRGVFYETLAAGLRVQAAEDWRDRLLRVAEVVDLRHRAGDASGYDRQRVAREQATTHATLSAAEADQAEATAELEGMIGALPEGEDSRISGELLDPTPPGFIGDLLQRVQERPDVRALQEEERAAGFELRVAEGWKVPSFTLGAGYKDVRDAGAGDLDGAVAYAAVPLPLLNRQRAPARRARARRRRAAGGARLLVLETQGKVRGTYSKERRLVSVAERFQVEAVEPAEGLRRTAEAAYKAGEVGILSLLDAYRSAYEARRQYLELALRARQARIELDRLTGGRTP